MITQSRKNANVHANSTSELDQVTSSNKVTSEEGREGIDGVVNTSVRSEVGLDLREEDHRAVSACAVELARPGETDGVVEGQMERLMGVLAALALKEVRLQVIEQREERAALNIESQYGQGEHSAQRRVRTAALEVTLPSGQVTRLMCAALA